MRRMVVIRAVNNQGNFSTLKQELREARRPGRIGPCGSRSEVASVRYADVATPRQALSSSGAPAKIRSRLAGSGTSVGPPVNVNSVTMP